MSRAMVLQRLRRARAHRPSASALGLGVVMLLVGSVVFGGSSRLGATVSSGDRASFFPLAPARLLETRSAIEGGGGTVDGQFNGVGALAAGSTLDLQVTGRGGVPADATSVVLNVTAVDQQGGLSFVTVFPTGTTRPNASNLNPSPGAPPAPNSVTATIGTGGKVSFFTLRGPVHLLADVVGYYAPHDHDDRYYTKAQVDAKFQTTGRAYVGAAAFAADGTGTRKWTSGCIRNDTTSSPLYADVTVPVGATITSITAWMIDGSASSLGRLSLYRTTNLYTFLAEAASTNATQAGVAAYASTLGTPEVVDPGDYFTLVYQGGDTTNHQICGATLTYTVPSGINLASAVTDPSATAPEGVPAGSEG